MQTALILWSGLLLAADDPLEPWKSGVIVKPVAPGELHSLHAYFNTCPESPDGKHVLYYASTAPDGHRGEVRIVERATGKTTVLARDIETEDAHRAACQQWVANGAFVVFHNRRPDGVWEVTAVEVATGKARTLAEGRQLGFGQPKHDVVPLYGPHWNPGKHRGLELLNVRTGAVSTTALDGDLIRKTYPDWTQRTFGEGPVSVFFPLLSPDLSRVMIKVACPAGGDFRSKQASKRFGLLCWDLGSSKFVWMREKWGHPAWHPDSRTVLEIDGQVIDGSTGRAKLIPNHPRLPGTHPSFAPDGRLFTSDTQCRVEPFAGPPGFWAVVAGDAVTGECVLVHRFDHSQGAKSWRPSHPHPIFSADGKRIYFNVSDGQWTRLHVAECRR